MMSIPYPNIVVVGDGRNISGLAETAFPKAVTPANAPRKTAGSRGAVQGTLAA
jgi:hypothetical protein